MKLLTVSHFFESHGGGIERVAGHLCRQFAAMGHEASWAASAADRPNDGDPVAAVPIRCVDPLEPCTGLPMPIPTPGGLTAVNRAVAACDAVIVHDALYLTSVAAVRAARKAGKPVVLVQHVAAIPFANPLLRGAMRAANRLVAAPMLRAADHVVTISDTTRRGFAHVRTQRPVHLLFNGVDGTLFNAQGPRDETVRPRLGLSAGQTLVLFVGRFVEKKGLTVLRAVAQQRPDIAFALAGQGPIDPRTWRLDNVHMLGPQSPQALARLYRSADALLLPSVGEGYPLVVQEAMACGLAVVCGAESARADPQAERWLHGVPIDLADPAGSAARCTAALHAALAGADERGARAAWATARYSWPDMAGRILALAGAARAERTSSLAVNAQPA